MRKIAIVHFQPIENYPPTTNFIHFLSQQDNLNCLVITNKRHKRKRQYTSLGITIKRVSKQPNSDLPGLARMLHYIQFNLFAFIHLFFFNPDIVLYYESYSVFPVYWYWRLFGKNKTLWMHSHEYFPPDWYATGMRTIRSYHKNETMFLYPRAKGLSQTNPYRVDFFLKDYPFLSAEQVHTFPNYPSKDWKVYSKNLNKISIPVKTLYIGSVSLRATYIKEYCTWLIAQEGKVTLDIYTYSIDSETRNFLTDLPTSLVRLFDEGIEYSKIPTTIQSKKYNVGLVLYKGLYTNTVYCASNKLFEYLACGLDVWLTDKMIGSFEYITEGIYPRVVKINFENLNEYTIEEIIDRKNLEYKPSEYFCDPIYSEFLNKLLK